MVTKAFLDKPTLIVGAGNSATGKTTHLLELARVLSDSFWIDKDTIEDTFLTKMDHTSDDILRYTSNLGVLSRKRSHHLEHVELQSYLLMLKEAKNNLVLGKHPILDGNYVRELQQDYFDKIIIPLFKDVNCNIKIIYFYAPEHIVKQRIIDRAEARDNDKLASEESWNNFLKKEPLLIHNLEKLPHLLVDSTKPIEENIKKIILFLKE